MRFKPWSLRYVFTVTSVLFWDVGELVGDATLSWGGGGALVGDPPWVTAFGPPGKSLFTVPSAVGPAIQEDDILH